MSRNLILGKKRMSDMIPYYCYIKRLCTTAICTINTTITGFILITLLTTLNVGVIADENSAYIYCTVCHGTNGNGNRILEAPKISGMATWYLNSQIMAFRAGYRGSHGDDETGNEMRAVSRMLTDQKTMAEAVNYITQLESTPSAHTISGDEKRGQTLYEACSTCHGKSAEGNEALHSPALSNQSDWYLVKQMQKYRSGSRGSHSEDIWGAQMRQMALTLPDDSAVVDVVAYIKSLE